MKRIFVLFIFSIFACGVILLSGCETPAYKNTKSVVGAVDEWVQKNLW